MIIRVLCVFVLSVTWCTALNLPSSFKKCDLRASDFDQCLSNAIQDAIQHLKEPLLEYGLPQLEPFQTPKEVILEYGNETTGIRQKYSNLKITGFTKIEKTSARFSLERKSLNVNITFTNILYESDYGARGRFIYLPIDVSTTTAINLKRPTLRIVFNLEEYEKENLKYFKARGGSFRMKMKNATFDFKNIFKKGCLNKELNDMMNEKWENILDYFQETFPELWISVFEWMFNNLLEKVPVSELFDGL
ncbi:hypothetical protein Zmor_018830 [Zophobas morio]|uniref:Uncharacterized protein n=1 Tax=Zophobas morio TaxID=2755281 RepID=A0AA38IAS8_9CUCU|nr:hypothetical protein Zmor_018830 [Zophobas morio]